MVKNAALSRRELLKLGVAAGAATTGALSPVLSRPALAAGLDQEVNFNVVDAAGVALLAACNAAGTFLQVDVLPSQFVGGVNVTRTDENIPGPGPGGRWEIPQNQMIVIPIPTTGAHYSFAKGGFAGVRAIALDALGGPSPNSVICYVALKPPAYMGSVSGSTLEGSLFRVAVPPGRNQIATLCVTAIAGGDVIVTDRATNIPLLLQSSVNQNHSFVVEAAVDQGAYLEVETSGSPVVCSALISRGPNRTRRLRVYPTKMA